MTNLATSCLSESDIQRQILDWLKARGIFHRRLPVGAVRHSGIAKKSPIKGFPDIMGFLPNTMGRAFFIEVKTSKGELSQCQSETINELIRQGAIVIVARCLEDVQMVLRLFPVAS